MKNHIKKHKFEEYENNKIHQFYSNLSILDNYGNEIKQQTISVNNPLRYKNIDFYQSDWNLLGIRVKNFNENFSAGAQLKYISERRDYGGSDNGFAQVILDDYSLINLYANYTLADYKLNFSLKPLMVA